MSHTTRLHIYPNDRIEEDEEFGNSWGSAPIVWDVLGKKYIGINFMVFKADESFWNLCKDTSIPMAHRAVFMMTFDTAYVTKKDYQIAAKDIRIFLKDFSAELENMRANHWPAFAEYYESNPDVPAIAYYQTSVTENPFMLWNEEKEDYLPNWAVAYDLYKELETYE